MEVEPFGFAADASLFLILLLANAEQHHSFSRNFFSSGSASTGNKGEAGVLLLVTRAKVNRSEALRIVILSPLCVKQVFLGVLLLVTRAKRECFYW